MLVMICVYVGEREKRKERDEDEGEQEEARTVGGVHVGEWVDMGSNVCV